MLTEKEKEKIGTKIQRFKCPFCGRNTFTYSGSYPLLIEDTFNNIEYASLECQTCGFIMKFNSSILTK